MHRLFPEPPADLDDRELERIYGYPDGLDRPWVQVNFVSSADGAVAVEGRSAGLSSPADKRIFALGRDLADVVLVGAGTARLEGYRGVKPTEVRAERRARLGLAEVPPIAVVTRRCSIGPDALLVTDTVVAPIVLTCAAAPAERRAALAAAGADVVVAGDHTVDLSAALAELAARGLRRVNCEGGPHLFGELIAEGLVDQLCLTLAPLLVSGDAPRTAVGLPPAAPLELELASVLTADGHLMLRYRRLR
ncbi:MAG TPA: pyrimidine reductase family protein [Actinophytocola sp.]|uniref:pyrimidine reductase family protein n=1 Tax=Actinophytocola sp. TaxID=1872138 RepID=UPI002DB7F19C|nr:pyrimidine reductase family protein [Actinophytocola sp.]HEU5474427.1 pyrimidine reductase family protein [Actinophytocola sp.]